MRKSVTIITATTGNPLLIDNLKSVGNQDYDGYIQHLVFVDGEHNRQKVDQIISENKLENPNLDVIYLPYSTGKDRFNGHRIYGAGTYLSEGDFLMFLDDDNYIDSTHVSDCMKVIENGKQWAYSFRKIVDKERNVLCQDDCESLGKWHSVIHPQDFFVDVNCYFLPKNLALSMSPVWYRKFREPGQMEIDRAMFHVLNQLSNNFDATYNYTVNYTVGNTALSVTADFFLQGNQRMLQLYSGNLPWKKN